MASFTCRDCGAAFSLAEATLAKYPNWQPKQCMDCRAPSPRAKAKPGSRAKSPALSTTDTLAAYQSGPNTGIFTDGSCDPNPGRGGWGAVKVIDGVIIEERFGGAPQTTNNRMELTALIEGYGMLAPGEAIPIYSDSNLCVRTVNEWAAGWEKRGWKKKTGEIANLDLVQPLYALSLEHPEAELRWIRAHVGSRWNEYADALARRHGAAG